ncbi:MAG: B12-binding domain-containing radical SAM protein [Candidatus Omnitrophica bacterium]|nr:B12-binding domain-containing radical SAM protein [Candidatus Omnitrophota bacterium]
MKKIALISLYGVENTGIRSISSVLKNDGIETYLIFFKKWLNNDIVLPSKEEKQILVSLLKELEIDMAGISFTSPFAGVAREIASFVRRSLNIKIISGGIHATVRPEECLEWCDFVCRGEGEYAMLELVRALGGKEEIGEIENITFRKNGRLISAGIRPLIQNLDDLPFQDYGGDNKFFIEKRLCRTDPMAESRELRVFASRGCPFNCSYCYNSIFREIYSGQRYFRPRSVEKVICEIEGVLSRFKKINRIKFDDDTFIFPREWVDEFCDKYEKRVGLPFEILFNAECIDEYMVTKLKDAGLKRVQVGVQTGSKDESENSFDRNLPSAKIIKFAWLAKKLGLNVVYDIILDNPLSTYDDKIELVNFLLSLPRPFDLFLYSLTVFPGTKMAEKLLRAGIISEDDIEGRSTKSFHQFRLSLSYPRDSSELFIASLVSLVSKRFVPKPLISLLAKNAYLKRHPLALKWSAELCNNIKLLSVASRMLREGTLSTTKFREYGLPRRFLIQ